MWPILILSIGLALAHDCGENPGMSRSFDWDTDTQTSPVDASEGGDESAEPEVYHWDNIYLERPAPVVIVDPYSRGGNRDMVYIFSFDEDDYEY